MHRLWISIPLFIFCSCSNQEHNSQFQKESSLNTFNSIKSQIYPCNTCDTMTLEVLLRCSDANRLSGQCFVEISDSQYLNANIAYLGMQRSEFQRPVIYDRKSNFITFHIWNDSCILLSDDFVTYESISIDTISSLIWQYYFEENKHLKYPVYSKDKGVHIRMYCHLNSEFGTTLLDTIASCYNRIIDEMCILKYGKGIGSLNEYESTKLIQILYLNSNITISSLDMPQYY